MFQLNNVREVSPDSYLLLTTNSEFVKIKQKSFSSIHFSLLFFQYFYSVAFFSIIPKPIPLRSPWKEQRENYAIKKRVTIANNAAECDVAAIDVIVIDQGGR